MLSLHSTQRHCLPNTNKLPQYDLGFRVVFEVLSKITVINVCFQTPCFKWGEEEIEWRKKAVCANWIVAPDWKYVMYMWNLFNFGNSLGKRLLWRCTNLKVLLSGHWSESFPFKVSNCSNLGETNTFPSVSYYTETLNRESNNANSNIYRRITSFRLRND